MSSCDDFIDLTNSFTPVYHSALADVIIELDTDESFVKSPVSQKKSRRHKTSKSSSTADMKDEISCKKTQSQRRISKKWSACPICWDDLGNNPLASTKCGHVFCLKCLEQCLRIEQKCPTCRGKLKGSNAYHPLYLN
ncbi:uncharacterized protein ACR2FA_011464 [Aphomia sociella]